MIREFVLQAVDACGVTGDAAGYVSHAILVVVAILIAALVGWLCRRLVVPSVLKLTAKTEAKWDDALFNRDVLMAACSIVPAIVIWRVLPWTFNDFPTVREVLTRLTEQERINFKKIVKGDLQKDSAGRESRRLIDKLAEATSARAPQVKKLVGYLRENRSRSIILCGDFNDGPISYAHHLVSQHLSDCYVMSGNGPGISYHEKWFFVRIDHMMCSDDWTPYKCKIDSKNNISDHYPLICWLKKQPKPQKNE